MRKNHDLDFKNLNDGYSLILKPFLKTNLGIHCTFKQCVDIFKIIKELNLYFPQSPTKKAAPKNCYFYQHYLILFLLYRNFIFIIQLFSRHFKLNIHFVLDEVIFQRRLVEYFKVSSV